MAAGVLAGLVPLAANVVAFLLAFQVSYWGHRLKTFEAMYRTVRRCRAFLPSPA
ncbi:hypothetical protein [Paludibacterium denitrificans]|uniref:hypothetical protein n=1 Tax=Paludibacterium denitrificans TaxID=2675226 RepID=UPI001E6399CA|nr:hypothetical protein [Paludibacterium denitrificans]